MNSKKILIKTSLEKSPKKKLEKNVNNIKLGGVNPLLPTIEPHHCPGVYVARCQNDAIQLLTRCHKTHVTPPPLSSSHFYAVEAGGKQWEYRVWSPYQYHLAAALLSGMEQRLFISEGAKVLYLGAGHHGDNVSHLSDILGETGVLYAVEHSQQAFAKLQTMAVTRTNILPIMEDAELPYKYRKKVASDIDIIYTDLPGTEQVRAVMLNARHFLREDGHFIMVVQKSKRSTENTLSVSEKNDMKMAQLKFINEISLEPYISGTSILIGMRKKSLQRSKKDVTKGRLI